MSSRYNRIRHGVLATSLMVLALAGVTLAQITGTISGTVTDADRVPLPGAAVTVDGTRLGATTDADGQYFILQVPPGAQSVTAQLIGFTPTTVSDVRVSAGLTTRVDFLLTEEAIEVDAITVTAERPPIQRDVTGTQTTVDASRVSEVPVARMIDAVNYQPGVDVVRGNELQIRGGGPSQIRIQVDGIDRTDGITGKGHTQMNQVLVSEVTLLTGGFNAEFGNVRSGMVNVVVKEGSERGGWLPWVAGVAGYAHPAKKHFGPGAYDEDQYMYRTFALSDSAQGGGAIYWPYLYEQTRADTAFMTQVANSLPTYRIFEGWDSRANSLNSARRGRTTFGHTDWTTDQLIRAWQYEANMNEEAWEYGHQPDWNVDLAAGWALPAKMGGVIVGYSYNKEMTPVPAVVPYYEDKSFETKLTLTPTDKLKFRLQYMTGTGYQTGASADGMITSPESSVTAANPTTGDPVALRSDGDISMGVVGGAGQAANNKLNLWFNSPLEGEFTSFGASVTYALSASTFFTAVAGRSTSSWKMERGLLRADMMEDNPYWPLWPNEKLHGVDPPSYAPSDSWTYPGLISRVVNFHHGYKTPPSLDFATNPDSVILLRGPFTQAGLFYEVPDRTIFEYRMIDDSIRVVSPQGFSPIKTLTDLTDMWRIADGAHRILDASATQTVLRTDMTHARGMHTFKVGAEYIVRDLEYHTEQVSSAGALLGAAGSNSRFRDYGGEYPAAQPKYLGVYVQDKYESDGMIANIGVRAERFDGGQAAIWDSPAHHYLSPHDSTLYTWIYNQSASNRWYDSLVVASGWKPEWGPILNPGNVAAYTATNDSLMKHYGVRAPLPSDIVRAWPTYDNKVHWKFAPRFGVSHPVSVRTKVFFNYGVFYQMQKAEVMYGYASSNNRPGSSGRVSIIYNPHLRPGSTRMYEAGVEQVLPLGAIARATGYAKYNEDQVSGVTVQGSPGFGVDYRLFRNLNYQDVVGYELMLTGPLAPFTTGMVTYERSTSRTGEVAFDQIGATPNEFAKLQLPFVRPERPQAFLRAQVRFATPQQWGALTGGWALSVVQSYRKGGQVIFNPDSRPIRELSEDHWLPIVDYYNTDLRLAKNVRLPGRHRTVTFYMDVNNLLNQKRLNTSGVGNYNTVYVSEIYYRRLAGEDIKVGDKSTFDWLTEPYKSAQTGAWNRPINPNNEWLHHLRPRAYRFGMRFEL